MIDDYSIKRTLKEAEQCLKTGKREEALRLFEQAINDDPESKRARLGHAETLFSLARRPECFEAYAHLCRLFPDDAEVWERKGTAACYLPGKEEEALQAYGQALRLDPERFKQCWDWKAQIEESLGRYAEAAASTRIFLDGPWDYGSDDIGKTPMGSTLGEANRRLKRLQAKLQGR